MPDKTFAHDHTVRTVGSLWFENLHPKALRAYRSYRREGWPPLQAKLVIAGTLIGYEGVFGWPVLRPQASPRQIMRTVSEHVEQSSRLLSALLDAVDD